MSISFAPPGMRAAASDLAVSVSPLGLIELSDEEFEVHGQRMARYASYWAAYLGYMWAYRAAPGETQVTANYARALTEYGVNFAFGRGVHFTSESKKYEHVVPALLKRIWEVDNNKKALVWEMGLQGSVSGDAFIKVAYDPGYEDPAGNQHPARVRILPLNSAHCFPEWHPHDRERLIRFKLKYRFWGIGTDGTRQAYTYAEVITDDTIAEYINDQLIEGEGIVNPRPNPLGTIPVAHIPNTPVPGSPWGLSDMQDVLALNRQYNETATQISEIVAYHAEPVTVVLGAKASNLERGAKKVWSIPNKDAKINNLDGLVDLDGPLALMDQLKRMMHEMTGVPETALGQVQAVSNTAGVALAIQYAPMVQKTNIKKMVYETGFRRINELALRTLFLFEPEMLRFDPDTEGIRHDDQDAEIDPADPEVYLTTCEWPEPMPVDVLVKLNEISMMMELGLESKRGALKALGEEFPDEKMQEIYEELVKDVEEQGALDMLRAQINSAILQETGIAPDGVTPPAPATPASEGQPATSPMNLGLAPQNDAHKVLTELVTQAHGTRTLPRRNSENDTAQESR
ncbi:phage portal protein [Streptomyces sp. NPDC017448]|uniref:phage portal protein n=1 Tax=Streptomyces sp. NPDC017448 TaxID=3364996 RepID=UPI0037B2E040